ncbi:hypothetical protein [Streptacidiphilus fuscans]|uniref:Ig-like domain-containing protein n=1 Tax=Streptacidiphilus fuscans TaxID=2789292 RepID=A0A931B200_9ACTN|nr:hypothetical protein [Streptacidiphilus fuscans]MBF9067227.1 hypothetical protein [Streptacidiphilus fuscans]
MRRSVAALASALAVASPLALGVATLAHSSAAQLLSCAVSSAESFSPGVQMASSSQDVSGSITGPGITAGPACGAAPDGITGLDATFTGKGAASCLPDPALQTVGLNGSMTITWKKADAATVGTSGITWTARQVELGSVDLAGTVTSGLFKGATLSVAGLSADAVVRVAGGCAPGSPLTSVRTTDTYLRLTH